MSEKARQKIKDSKDTHKALRLIEILNSLEFSEEKAKTAKELLSLLFDDLGERRLEHGIILMKPDERTIRRDMDTLSVLGFKVMSRKEGKANAWYLSEKEQGRFARYSDAAAFSFLFLGQIAKDTLPNAFKESMNPYFNKAKTHFERIAASGEEKALVNLADRIRVIESDIRSQIPELNSAFLKVIREAIENEKNLEIAFYERGQNAEDAEVYKVSPYGVVSRRRRLYVVGYDHNTQSWKHFVLSRVTSCEISDGFSDEYEPIGDRSLDDYIQEGHITFPQDPELGGRPVRIKLRCSRAECAHIFEGPAGQPLHTLGDHPEDTDTHFILETELPYTEELIWWVMSHIGCMEVLEPQNIRQHVIDGLQKSLSLYRTGNE